MQIQSNQQNLQSRSSLHVAVTGGVGLLGHQIIQDLLDHGHHPVCVDVRRPEKHAWNKHCPDRVADLTDLGQTFGALRDVDAVIHCAAIPWAGTYPPEVVFRTNMLSHFNVLQACAGLGIRKVVTASSIQVINRVRTEQMVSPLYFPVDEEHPCVPDTEYGMSKEAGEAINRMFHRRYGIRTASIRLPGVLRADRIQERLNVAEEARARGLWSYIDPRDAAQCFRLAVESDAFECEIFNASADEVLSLIPSQELLNRYYPQVEVRQPLGEFSALFSNDKARQVLGFTPQYPWRRTIEMSGAQQG